MKKRYAKATWTRVSEQPGKRGQVSITYIQTIIVSSIQLDQNPDKTADIAAVWANKPKGDGWTLSGAQLPEPKLNARQLEAEAEARVRRNCGTAKPMNFSFG